MSNGMHIVKRGSFIENYLQNSGELRLLGKGDGAEVMIQKIKANETVFIEPGDYDELMEFFYILEGELEFDDKSDNILKEGDYFYSHFLKETVQFTTITDVKLLYFSTQPLFHYLSSTIRELVELAKNVEEKDTYTHSHIQRVKDYAVKIGNRMRLSKEKIENIGFAALFHDLGKINIPNEILKKPCKLTDEEFEYIKKHSADGAALVSSTYYSNLSEIIRQHHERVDGSGYPDGITGSDIKIEARIIAVADTFDAMTSDRIYRKKLSTEIAVAELESLKGKHYDEEVVDALIEILKEEHLI